MLPRLAWNSWAQVTLLFVSQVVEITACATTPSWASTLTSQNAYQTFSNWDRRNRGDQAGGVT
jgi:hypothetical protein